MTEVTAKNSTNVRANYPSPPRANLGWLERHVPALTLRLAEHWFFRPGKRQFTLQTGDAEHLLETEVGGEPLRVAGWGNGPNVIAAHGWAGGGEQFGSLRRAVVSAGFRFWSFDMPGHGATAGRSAHVGLFARAISRAADRIGRVHAVVGHSLGGTAASLAVARGLELQGLVLIAPMPSVDFALEGFTRLTGLSSVTREQLKTRALLRASLREDEQSLFGLARRPACSLFIHDRDDRMVPVQQSRALVNSWPRAELVETEKRGHNRVLQDASVAGEVCRFLRELPSPPHTPLDRQLMQLDQLTF